MRTDGRKQARKEGGSSASGRTALLTSFLPCHLSWAPMNSGPQCRDKASPSLPPRREALTFPNKAPGKRRSDSDKEAWDAEWTEAPPPTPEQTGSGGWAQEDSAFLTRCKQPSSCRRWSHYPAECGSLSQASAVLLFGAGPFEYCMLYPRLWSPARASYCKDEDNVNKVLQEL